MNLVEPWFHSLDVQLYKILKAAWTFMLLFFSNKNQLINNIITEEMKKREKCMWKVLSTATRQ